jgi:hypothetical protein
VQTQVTCRPEREGGQVVLDAAAFASLDEFTLRRRFVEPRTGLVPTHFRERIRPLTSQAAAELAGEATSRAADAVDFTVTFRTDDSPGLVNDRVRDLPLAPDTAVVVWWNAATAVVTDWELFASYWDDFCYPAADDVCIWPLAGGWTLCYRRYEVFQFRGGPRGVR